MVTTASATEAAARAGLAAHTRAGLAAHTRARLAAHTRAPIHLAATSTGAPTRPAARTAIAPAAPRAGAGRADAAVGLAACARRGRVDTRRRTRQQLGVALRDDRKRLRGRICRQEAGA